MYPAVAVLMVVIVLTPAATLGVMYLQYRSWPPFLWKTRVARLVGSLRDRREQLRLEEGADGEIAALFDGYFERYLRTIALEVLDEHPGIGPATVARLRDAGYRTLESITHARFESIPGIGPTRASALRDAVRTLVRQARSRFDAGACPEALEYRRRADAARAAERERREERERTLAAVGVALREGERLDEVAAGVTFWTYLFHRDEPGVSDAVMSRPLPTVVVPPRPPAVPVAQVVAVPPPVPVPAAVAAAKPPPPSAASPTPAPAVPPAAPAADAHPWLPRMRAFARFAFAVAKSDGRVAQSERKVIRSFLAAKFGHHEVLARHIDPLMEQVEGAVPAEAEAVAEVRPMTTAIERRELYQLAERIADAAGERKAREQEALERIAGAFGVVADRPVTASAGAPAPSPPGAPAPADSDRAARAVLEIPPDAELTAELIRRRFALLSDRIDPAKARLMGPEFARLAEEKAALLRGAAERLLAPLHEPLEKPGAPDAPADPRHNPDLDAAFGG